MQHDTANWQKSYVAVKVRTLFVFARVAPSEPWTRERCAWGVCVRSCKYARVREGRNWCEAGLQHTC